MEWVKLQRLRSLPVKLKRTTQQSHSAARLLNPLVPGMQNLKIRQFNIGCLIVSTVKRLVCLDTHYSERQGLMG